MAASYLQQGVDYTAPLDTSTLIVEVSSSAFCFRNKIKPASVSAMQPLHAWETHKLETFTLSAFNVFGYVGEDIVGQAQRIYCDYA